MKRCLILAAILAALLCGCYADGYIVESPYPTKSVREKNLEIQAKAKEAYEDGYDYWDSMKPNIQPVDESCVYWVPKGYSYHSTKDCVALFNSKTILHGSLDEAKEAGKYDPCSKCVGG